MTLISKTLDVVQQPVMPVLETPYELYTTETALDATLKEVTILKKIGTFTVESLEREKANLLARVTEIDEKLASIAEVNSETNVFYAAEVAEQII